MANGDNQDLANAIRQLIDQLKKPGTQNDPGQSDNIQKKQKELSAFQKEQNAIFEERKKKQEEYEEALKRQETLEKKMKSARQAGDKERLRGLKAQLNSAKAITDEYEEQTKELDEQLSRTSKLKTGFSKLAEGAGKAKDAIVSVGRAANSAATQAEDMANKFGGLEKSLLNLDTAKEQANSIDKLSVSLQRSSGLSGDLSSTIVDTQKELRAFGITSQDTSDTIKSLGTGLSDFTRMDKTTREELTKSVAKFKTLGISVDDTTKLLEVGTKTLGMSQEQAITLQEDLTKTAKAIGVAPSQLVQGFAQAAPKLAAHGANMERVFKGLALQSKNTGASVDDLLNIAEGFDTFEDAARKTSQLNAMFGTQLNSVELLNASEEERVQILQSSLAATGKSIDQMGRFELKSLANIIGVDVATVRQTFGAAQDGLADLEDKAGAAKSEVNLEEEMLKTVTAQERLNATNEAFKNTTVEQILPAIRDQALSLATNNDLMKEFEIAGNTAGAVYGTLIKKATDLQGQFAKISGTVAGIDLTTTLLTPLTSAMNLLSSMTNIFTGPLKAGFNMLKGGFKGLGGGISDFLKGDSRIAKGLRSAGAGVKNLASKIPGAKAISGFMKGGNPIANFFRGFAPKLAKFGGPILTSIIEGVNAYGILNNEKLSSTDKAKGLLKIGGGLIGGTVLGIAGAAGGPITAMLGAGAGDYLGRMIASSDTVQNLLAPPLGKALDNMGFGAQEVTAGVTSPIAPMSVEASSVTAGATASTVTPPRATPTATATNAQTSTIMSGMQQTSTDKKQAFQPVINLTAYVGDKKTASRLVVDGLNDAMTLGGVPTAG